MGKRGPTREPTPLQLVKGTKRGRARAKVEPKRELAIPDPPKHLNKAALAEWKRLAPLQLKRGLMELVYRDILADYCQSVADIAELTGRVREEGAVLEAANGNMYRNPSTTLLKEARELRMKLGARLGLSPSEASGLPAKPQEDESDPLTGMLDG